jgi:hypothetical protein
MKSAIRAPHPERSGAMYRTALLVLLLLASGAAACRGEPEPTPAEQAARREARRDACIAEHLQERAQARLATLDTLLAQAQAAGTVTGVVSAPHAFAQVYATLADLRAHDTAYRDSAFHARSRDDSLRYETAAATFRVRRPSPETLEANVQRDYARDFVMARGDPEHICNHLVADGSTPRGRER